MSKKEIYLAGGCYWGVEKYISSLKGVLTTTVGFANGHVEAPTYEQVKHEDTGHAETVRVVYDPEVLPLPLLLDLFYKIIDPTTVDQQGEDIGHQYRTGVYFTDPTDEVIVRASVLKLAQKVKAPLALEVCPLEQFWDAEEYHQKYLDKNPGGYCHVSWEMIRWAQTVDPQIIGRYSMDTNCIKNYRRIGNWENFFLDSAIYSIAEYVGVTYENGFTPIAAITGDLFTYMYSDTMPCDSGVTNYVVMPERVIKAYASFGWQCEYISRDVVRRDISMAISKIHASIDRGLPVLAWGVGGVPGMEPGEIMGEGALIGGYEDDLLLVHLYCGAERLPEVSYGDRPGVDENGYTAIPANEALSDTDGIFILTNKIAPSDPETVFREVVGQIPTWLTMPSTGGRVSDTEQYTFGTKAFARWASVLLDDPVWQECDEDMIWNKHCSAFCALCTSTGSFGGDSRVVDWLIRVKAACQDLTIIDRILPLYRKMSELWQQMWDLQEGFMPSTEKMKNRDYRVKIADILMQMGDCCDEIGSVTM